MWSIGQLQIWAVSVQWLIHTKHFYSSDTVKGDFFFICVNKRCNKVTEMRQSLSTPRAKLASFNHAVPVIVDLEKCLQFTTTVFAQVYQAFDVEFISIINSMVYGRILYNNIKEYTPKNFPTIPYSQTTKPIFGRQPQVISKFNANPQVKRGWRLLGKLFNHSWAYQIFIFGLTFGLWATFYFPCLWFYQMNNRHRTYEAAITKEKAHKKKLREAEEAESAAEGQ